VAPQLGNGLARLTIATPDQRIDLCVPENVPLAELVPAFLHHLRDSIYVPGHSSRTGWTIRCSDGRRLATDRSLAEQHIRDGEILRLVSVDQEWPEPDDDDMVLAVVRGAAALGHPWHGGLTRRTALLITATVPLLGLPILLSSGPSWLLPAVSAFSVALAILIGATILSRAVGDSTAGGGIGVIALPYAFTGGLLILADNAGLSELTAAHVLLGSVAVVLVSVLGAVAIGDRLWLYVAGAVTGLHGALGAALSLLWLDGVAAAAVTVGVVLALMPLSTMLSVRLSKLPMPDLPQTTEDLLADRPPPPRDEIFVAVARAEELLVGMLLGFAVAAGAGMFLLTTTEDLAARALAGTCAALLLLRARSLTRVRQRVPLLCAGLLGLGALALAVAWSQSTTVLALLVPLGLVPLVLAVAGLGLRYARRRPGPQLARLADVGEVLLGLAVMPEIVGVLGLFAYVRGLGG
jgi:type VII secretion integral membrane protein EccD